MDYFVTTYRKDFKWPVLKADFPDKKFENELKMKELGLNDAEPCLKETIKDPVTKNEGGEGQSQTKTQIQQQAGLGSKYLEKLFKKYPYLNNVMKFTNPDEMVKKILHEKYKTTYQVEYNKEDFHPANNFKEAMDIVDTVEKMKFEEKPKVFCASSNGAAPINCECAQGLTYVPCKCAKDAPIRKIAWRPALISKIPQAPREKKKKSDEEEKAEKAAGESGKQKLKPFCSEYNDTIGKIGGIIIKRKLLHKEGDNTKEGKK